MLGDSINTNNFNCNLVVLKKKLEQFLKIAIFGPNLGKKGGSLGSRTQNKKQFFTAITKPDDKLPKTFDFIKITYVLTKL